MGALFAGLWYSFLILIKIIWLPATIIIAVAIISRIIGKIRKGKDEKK